MINKAFGLLALKVLDIRYPYGNIILTNKISHKEQVKYD